MSREVLALRRSVRPWRAVADDPGRRPAVHRRYAGPARPFARADRLTPPSAPCAMSKRFGVERPRWRLSAFEFGNRYRQRDSGCRMRAAMALLDARGRVSPMRAKMSRRGPRLPIRERIFPGAGLRGANVLIPLGTYSGPSGSGNALAARATWRSGRSDGHGQPRPYRHPGSPPGC